MVTCQRLQLGVAELSEHLSSLEVTALLQVLQREQKCQVPPHVQRSAMGYFV
jgi:hypothetical protein